MAIGSKYCPMSRKGGTNDIVHRKCPSGYHFDGCSIAGNFTLEMGRD